MNNFKQFFWLALILVCSCNLSNTIEIDQKSRSIDFSNHEIELGISNLEEDRKYYFCVTSHDTIVYFETLEKKSDQCIVKCNLYTPKLQTLEKKLKEDYRTLNKIPLKIEIKSEDGLLLAQKELQYEIVPPVTPERLAISIFSSEIIEVYNQQDPISIFLSERNTKFLEFDLAQTSTVTPRTGYNIKVITNQSDIHHKVIAINTDEFQLTNFTSIATEVESVLNTDSNTRNISVLAKSTDSYNLNISRENGIYSIVLLSFDKERNFSMCELDRVRIDSKGPEFRHTTPSSCYEETAFDGVVELNTKEFFGYSPYLVPIVGCAKGDVAQIYFNKQKIDFQSGVEFFLKKYISLDNGYNRIPIKLVDIHGNENDTFLEITIVATDSDYDHTLYD